MYKILLQLYPSASQSVCKRCLPVDWKVDRFNSGNISWPLHYHHLQYLKHQALAQQKGHQCNSSWTSFDRGIVASYGCALLHPLPDIVIKTDASRMGWGVVCQGVQTGGGGALWSQMDRKLHINCLRNLK